MSIDHESSNQRPSLRSTLADRWLVALLGAGLLLRLGLALLTHGEMILRGDEYLYTREAAALLEAGQLETGTPLHPPLYFLVLAAVKLLAGEPHEPDGAIRRVGHEVPRSLEQQRTPGRVVRSSDGAWERIDVCSHNDGLRRGAAA